MAKLACVLKEGTFTKKQIGKKQPGLDLSRAIGDFLVDQGLATTTDCCKYNLGGQSLTEGYKKFIPEAGDTITAMAGDNFIVPAALIATLTVNLPSSPNDGQTVHLTFGEDVSTLTVDPGSETVLNTPPSTAAAGDRFSFKFYTGYGWARTI